MKFIKFVIICVLTVSCAHAKNFISTPTGPRELVKPFDTEPCARAKQSCNKELEQSERFCKSGEIEYCTHSGNIYSYKGNHTKAMERWNKACSSGSYTACANIGMSYNTANGVSRDITKAEHYSKIACDKFIMEACTQLGMVYKEKGQYTQARDVLERACGAKELGACFVLGGLYSDARTGMSDMSKSFKLFDNVCRHGHGRVKAVGCEQLGIRLLLDDNLREGERQLKSACKMGQQASCDFVKFIKFIDNTNEIKMFFYLIGTEGLIEKDAQKSFEFAKKSCNENAVMGCYFLGLQYASGENTQKDYKLAKQSFNMACQPRNKDKIFYKESCEFLALFQYELGEYDSAFPAYEKMCKDGKADKCATLGDMYRHGNGVEKDVVKAKEILTNSCNANNMDGCLKLGNLYLDNNNTQKSIEFYTKVCDNKYPMGCHNIAVAYEKIDDINNTRKFYQMACDNNYTTSCVSLGLSYIKSEPRDAQTGAKYHQLACNNGSEYSCNNLALLYMYGDGVEMDRNKSFNMFDQSCRKDDKFACNNLGNSYLNGYGTEQNITKAIEIYSKNCDNNNSDSCVNLAKIYTLQGSNKADELYRKACIQDNTIACAHVDDSNRTNEYYTKFVKDISKSCEYNYVQDCIDLAYLYEAGVGVKKDSEMANKLYKKSCKLGGKIACKENRD